MLRKERCLNVADYDSNSITRRACRALHQYKDTSSIFHLAKVHCSEIHIVVYSAAADSTVYLHTSHTEVYRVLLYSKLAKSVVLKSKRETVDSCYYDHG